MCVNLWFVFDISANGRTFSDNHLLLRRINTEQTLRRYFRYVYRTTHGEQFYTPGRSWNYYSASGEPWKVLLNKWHDW